ncbi:PASK kinase, partial [Piaya cayana]|nr:PASK kinase [Piaya cayana]
ILVANDKACKLLGRSSRELIGQKLSRLISKSSQEVWEAGGEDCIHMDEGFSMVSGTVVDVINRLKEKIPVSVWLRRIRSKASRCCVVVLEPVERFSTSVAFRADVSVFLMNKCDCGLQETLRTQRAVGYSREGNMFPLSLTLRVTLLEEDQAARQDADIPQTEAGGSFTRCYFSATVVVFSTISGLITLRSDGTICGIKDSFALMLFGYEKEELLGK